MLDVVDVVEVGEAIDQSCYALEVVYDYNEAHLNNKVGILEASSKRIVEVVGMPNEDLEELEMVMV